MKTGKMNHFTIFRGPRGAFGHFTLTTKNDLSAEFDLKKLEVKKSRRLIVS